MHPRFILCVCGGRVFSDQELAFHTLDRIHAKRPITELVHGAAPGADRLAGQWAKSRNVPTKEFPANWEAHGRGAGPIRNGQMVAYGLDGLVAFPGGRGTDNMIAQCRDASVIVMHINSV
ncbi:DUF2493 domain-containing protein [Comamonas sp. B-9]|uniref:DUF2493 domain-containing protein n=1 Tax=Comamonas sp. B-9 TaxID=1055192 RepID=UPI0005B8F1E6